MCCHSVVNPSRETRTAPGVSAKEWSWDELLAEALGCGLTVQDFWELTPRETVEVVRIRNERQRERDLWRAWHAAALQRMKRLPPCGA